MSDNTPVVRKGLKDIVPHRTEVVNIDRCVYDEYIGRAGHGFEGFFGNYVEDGQNRYQRVAAFKEHFLKRIESDTKFCEAVESLRGKRLGCFCMPLECHGMVIVEYLEGVGFDQQKNEYVSRYLRRSTRVARTQRTPIIEPDMFDTL
jgi:hypothetical protein